MRELRVLEDCRVSILAERRPHAPNGGSGGGGGAQAAPSSTATRARQGPRNSRPAMWSTETPGGGGFGSPTRDRRGG